MHGNEVNAGKSKGLQNYLLVHVHWHIARCTITKVIMSLYVVIITRNYNVREQIHLALSAGVTLIEVGRNQALHRKTFISDFPTPKTIMIPMNLSIFIGFLKV